MTFRIFRAGRFHGIVGNISEGADYFVITGSSIIWVSSRGTNAQVIASPFILVTICGRSAEGGVVKVDAGIDNTNQHTFAVSFNATGCFTIPNGRSANQGRTFVGIRVFDGCSQNLGTRLGG